MERKLIAAPDKIVDSHGVVATGVFDAPLKDVNLEDASLSTGGIPWPGWWRRMRLKEWQHVWIGGEDFYFGFAAVDGKFIKTGFSYFYDRREAGGQFVERTLESPRFQARIPSALGDSHGHLISKGFMLHIHNHLDRKDGGQHRYSLQIPAAKDEPSIMADVTLHEDLAKRQPLVVVLPFGDNAGLYSHKSIVPVNGEVGVDGRRHEITPDRFRAVLDVHKAHYPYRSFWNWTTFWGYDVEGREIGINLTDNVAIDADETNECAFWLEGRMHRLGRAVVEHPKGDTLSEWKAGTRDGQVRLRFHPEGERKGRIELALVSSKFHQPFGTYEGEVELPGGQQIKIDRAWGIAEDHKVRW